MWCSKLNKHQILLLLLLFLLVDYFLGPFSPGAEITTYYIKYEVHSKKATLLKMKEFFYKKKLSIYSLNLGTNCFSVFLEHSVVPWQFGH